MKKISQKLPVGDSSFERIRQDDLLYVDKTRHIHRLLEEGRFYFMARPRRFGKSLTVSTLRCLFQGRRDLFERLWIGEHGARDWKRHPTVLIDFNGIDLETPEIMKLSLLRTLEKTAEAYDVVSDAPLLKNRFKELIVSLRRKTGMRVAVLIDEYDKPLIDHLGRGERAFKIAEANRDLLKGFLGVLKDGDVSPALEFVFVTGVSKFSRISLFSELNNLDDLTMSETCADMFGYTQEELEVFFTPHIRAMSEKLGYSEAETVRKLRRHYDGYRFSRREIRVYNPFSILCALKNKHFGNYWFETGTPAFLVNLLKNDYRYLPRIENLQTSEAVFGTYDLEHLKPEALLFQTGYITILDIEDRLCTLGYPNEEVKMSFLESLFHACTGNVMEAPSFLQLSRYLCEENHSAFFETVSSIFASIPYILETKRDEAYFHSLFYLMVRASGADADGEVLTCEGRIDMVVELSDKFSFSNSNATIAPKLPSSKSGTRTTRYPTGSPARRSFLSASISIRKNGMWRNGKLESRAHVFYMM